MVQKTNINYQNGFKVELYQGCLCVYVGVGKWWLKLIYHKF